MKMKLARTFLLLLLTLFAGCATSDAFVSRAVRRSKAYESMTARSSNTTFVIEEKHAGYAVVALGDMRESELERFYTLRISSTGSVKRGYVDVHGGITWTPDR